MMIAASRAAAVTDLRSLVDGAPIAAPLHVAFAGRAIIYDYAVSRHYLFADDVAVILTRLRLPGIRWALREKMPPGVLSSARNFHAR